jgi:hypothetical protein
MQHNCSQQSASALMVSRSWRISMAALISVAQRHYNTQHHHITDHVKDNIPPSDGLVIPTGRIMMNRDDCELLELGSAAPQ